MYIWFFIWGILNSGFIILQRHLGFTGLKDISLFLLYTFPVLILCNALWLNGFNKGLENGYSTSFIMSFQFLIYVSFITFFNAISTKEFIFTLNQGVGLLFVLLGCWLLN